MKNPAEQFLSDPQPTRTSVDAANPAQPLPQYQQLGVPQPTPVPAQPHTWNKAAANPFPMRSLVTQPRRLTVIP